MKSAVRLFTLFALISAVGTVVLAAEPHTHTVQIENMKYSPETLSASEGDIIVFINQDIVPHTVTDAQGAQFDSGLIESGKEWRFTVSGQGPLQYYCRVHPNMKGTIEIKVSK